MSLLHDVGMLAAAVHPAVVARGRVDDVCAVDLAVELAGPTDSQQRGRWIPGGAVVPGSRVIDVCRQRQLSARRSRWDMNVGRAGTEGCTHRRRGTGWRAGCRWSWRRPSRSSARSPSRGRCSGPKTASCRRRRPWTARWGPRRCRGSWTLRSGIQLRSSNFCELHAEDSEGAGGLQLCSGWTGPVRESG